MKLPLATDEGNGPNLTPIIDVVFLLLIFFLVATRFDQEEKLVSIRLAEILKAQPLASGPQEVVVNINDKGEYILVNETKTESQLIDILHTKAVNNPGRVSVQIRADQEVKFRYPLTVIGICKEEGIDYSCTVLER